MVERKCKTYIYSRRGDEIREVNGHKLVGENQKTVKKIFKKIKQDPATHQIKMRLVTEYIVYLLYASYCLVYIMLLKDICKVRVDWCSALKQNFRHESSPALICCTTVGVSFLKKLPSACSLIIRKPT